MHKNSLLWTGQASGILFIFGTLILGMLLPNYHQLAQTVSEIGKLGSEFQSIYASLLIFVGSFALLFSWSLRCFAKANQLSMSPVYLIALFALLDIGFALFPSPNSLHNIIGIGHLPAYFSPLILVLTWKHILTPSMIAGSWLAFVLILTGLTLNLSPLFNPALYPLEYYGVVQRVLLYSYFGWLIFISFNLNTMTKKI